MNSRKSSLIDRDLREREAIEAVNSHVARLEAIHEAMTETNRRLAELEPIRKATEAVNGRLAGLAPIQTAAETISEQLADLAPIRTAAEGISSRLDDLPEIKTAAQAGRALLSDSKSVLQSLRRILAVLTVCAAVIAAALLWLVLRPPAGTGNSYNTLNFAMPRSGETPVLAGVEVEMAHCFASGSYTQLLDCESGEKMAEKSLWKVVRGDTVATTGQLCQVWRSIRAQHGKQHLLVLLFGGHDAMPLSGRATATLVSNHNLAWQRALQVTDQLKGCADPDMTVLSVAGGTSALIDDDPENDRKASSADRRVRMQVIALGSHPQ